jgi:hypothetical protein
VSLERSREGARRSWPAAPTCRRIFRSARRRRRRARKEGEEGRGREGDRRVRVYRVGERPLEQHERDINGEQRSYPIGTLLFWQSVLNIVGKASYEKLRLLDIFPMPCSKTCKLRMACEGDNMEEFTPAIFLKVSLLFFVLDLDLVLSSLTKSPSIFYSLLFSACKSTFECTT